MSTWKQYPGFDVRLNAPVVDAPWNQYDDGTFGPSISEGWVYDSNLAQGLAFGNGQISSDLTRAPLIDIAPGFRDNVRFRASLHDDPFATCSALNCSHPTDLLPVYGTEAEEAALNTISRRTHSDPNCFFEVVDEMTRRSCKEYQLSSPTGSGPDEATVRGFRDKATRDVAWDCGKCSALTKCGESLATGRETPFYSRETNGLETLLCGDCSVTSVASLLSHWLEGESRANPQ